MCGGLGFCNATRPMPFFLLDKLFMERSTRHKQRKLLPRKQSLRRALRNASLRCSAGRSGEQRVTTKLMESTHCSPDESPSAVFVSYYSHAGCRWSFSSICLSLIHQRMCLWCDVDQEF